MIINHQYRWHLFMIYANIAKIDFSLDSLYYMIILWHKTMIGTMNISKMFKKKKTLFNSAFYFKNYFTFKQLNVKTAD